MFLLHQKKRFQMSLVFVCMGGALASKMVCEKHKHNVAFIRFSLIKNGQIGRWRNVIKNRYIFPPKKCHHLFSEMVQVSCFLWVLFF